MSEKRKNPGLTAAAEALIEAASLEADAVTQKQLVANLESLKTSFDSNLNMVAQKIDSSNVNFDAKINMLNQHFVDVKSDIGTLKSLMEEELKQKTLERARDLTEFDSFYYYNSGSGYGEKRDSSDLAKRALGSFMLGYGMNLPKDGRMNMDEFGAPSEQSKKDFRDKFTQQMKDLIKREPRVVQNSDGTWAIHYS